MDFTIFFRLKEKRFWWVDVLFYFMISLFLAVVFSYSIFLLKNYFLKKQIQETITALETVGTAQQKEYEDIVLYYQKKIIAFNKLFSNHAFTSRIFPFFQEKTLPYVWYKQFEIDRKNRKVQVVGESEDMEMLSRQIMHLEKSEFVDSIGNLHTSLGEGGRSQFNFHIVFRPEIFNYLPGMFPVEEKESEETEKPLEEQNQIILFSLLLNPEAIGKIDQETNTISVEVPYGTDLTNIQPLIITSAGAEVNPASGIAQDFSKPVTYRVTGKDGSTRVYVVNVSVLPPPTVTPAPKARTSPWVIVLVILLCLIIIGLSIFLFIQWWQKRRLEIKKSKEIKF